jgi:hypothetical protein
MHWDCLAISFACLFLASATASCIRQFRAELRRLERRHNALEMIRATEGQLIAEMRAVIATLLELEGRPVRDGELTYSEELAMILKYPGGLRHPDERVEAN